MKTKTGRISTKCSDHWGGKRGEWDRRKYTSDYHNICNILFLFKK